MNVELNATNLKDLIFLLSLVEEYYKKKYDLPLETFWRERAIRYRSLFEDYLERENRRRAPKSKELEIDCQHEWTEDDAGVCYCEKCGWIPPSQARAGT
jgi:hypothetical protein